MGGVLLVVTNYFCHCTCEVLSVKSVLDALIIFIIRSHSGGHQRLHLYKASAVSVRPQSCHKLLRHMLSHKPQNLQAMPA